MSSFYLFDRLFGSERIWLQCLQISLESVIMQQDLLYYHYYYIIIIIKNRARDTYENSFS
jgi:hypothetical protein